MAHEVADVRTNNDHYGSDDGEDSHERKTHPYPAKLDSRLRASQVYSNQE